MRGWGSGVGFKGNNRRARGGEDELEFGEVMGTGFVGVGRGREVVKAGFGGIGGAEGRRVDLAVGEEKEVDERAEFGRFQPAASLQASLQRNGCLVKIGSKASGSGFGEERIL